MACVERGIGRQGPYWHASAKGLLIERGQYKNGDPAGVWTQWLETGSVAKQTTYADDGSVLHEVTFFENGNKDREATYAGRRRVNTKAEYERIPAGTTRQWFPDGTLRSEENYSNGLLEGPSKEFGPDGSLLVTGQYARGRVVGEWKRYWRQKQLRWSGAFVDGKKDGKWMYWTQSGQLRASVEWALGVRKSDWKPLIAHKPLTPAERAKLAEAQCNAGSENYCADAGAGFLQKGCELGAAGACAAIAEKLPASEASQRDKLFERVCVLTLDANCSEKAKRWPAVIPEMEMGCEKGIAGDCERLSWWYSYKADPLDVRRSNAMSARAVELYSKRCPSVPHACYLAVRAGEKAEVKMLPDMRDALYRRGCDAGDGESCWSLGRDKETMRADRACDLGVSNGCFFAGAPLHYGEPVGDLYEAMERLERGCELGHDTACAYLSATVEKLKGDTK